MIRRHSGTAAILKDAEMWFGGFRKAQILPDNERKENYDEFIKDLRGRIRYREGYLVSRSTHSSERCDGQTVRALAELRVKQYPSLQSDHGAREIAQYILGENDLDEAQKDEMVALLSSLVSHETQNGLPPSSHLVRQNLDISAAFSVLQQLRARTRK
ncbi:hypothetical protein BX600DRAFT_470264 [Xylariales sp. PMI_506]|nr:hypothetical protein BX600DRAFT_470264 [Xylariales sp. PMI_506]